jgi:hypothetical protein
MHATRATKPPWRMELPLQLQQAAGSLAILSNEQRATRWRWRWTAAAGGRWTSGPPLALATSLHLALAQALARGSSRRSTTSLWGADGIPPPLCAIKTLQLYKPLTTHHQLLTLTHHSPLAFCCCCFRLRRCSLSSQFTACSLQPAAVAHATSPHIYEP